MRWCLAPQRPGFMPWRRFIRKRFARSAALTSEAAESISDLQFTASYRVPFQFSRHVRQHLEGRQFFAGQQWRQGDRSRWQRVVRPRPVRMASMSSATTSTRSAWPKGQARVQADSGRCWAPITRWWRITPSACATISGLDEVSFHMSGTEAVMQAVRSGALPHREAQSGALLRRLSRLVGGRAAGHRQPACRRAKPTP
jgi:glutamate-1-semialdehyde 2,1-aminomutase